MSETVMWLFPLALMAATGMFITARAGLGWTWGTFVQQSLILICSVLGFLFLYAPQLVPGLPGSEQAAKVCTWTAWILFLIFNIAQRILLNRFMVDLSLMKLDDARSMLGYVRALAWGPPGRYWSDMVTALSLIYQGKSDEANELMGGWQTNQRMSVTARESMSGFSMLGRVIQGDWESIITAFESQKFLPRGGSAVPTQLAARAYAEMHKYTESLACLIMLMEQSGRTAASTVDVNFVPFFALSGALDELNLVFQRIGKQPSMPDYAQTFWRGRCYAVRGDSTAALRYLAEAREKTKPTLTVWHERIDKQIHAQQLIASGAEPNTAYPAESGAIRQAWDAYRKYRQTAEIVRPGRAKPGLITMMVLLVVAFAVGEPFNWFQKLVPLQTQVMLATWQGAVLQWGQLDSNVWRGQWWRLITYIFLHGNTPHLALNTAGLYLFGKSVENVYGTRKFLLIFFGAGLLSGAVQILALPQEPALGASGAILGVFGAAIAGTWKLKKILPAPIRKAELRWMLSIALLQVIFDQLVNNFAEATDKSHTGVRIAAFAHGGGIIAGLLLGLLLPIKKPKDID